MIKRTRIVILVDWCGVAQSTDTARRRRTNAWHVIYYADRHCISRWTRAAKRSSCGCRTCWRLTGRTARPPTGRPCSTRTGIRGTRPGPSRCSGCRRSWRSGGWPCRPAAGRPPLRTPGWPSSSSRPWNCCAPCLSPTGSSTTRCTRTRTWCRSWSNTCRTGPAGPRSPCSCTAATSAAPGGRRMSSCWKTRAATATCPPAPPNARSAPPARTWTTATWPWPSPLSAGSTACRSPPSRRTQWRSASWWVICARSSGTRTAGWSRTTGSSHWACAAPGRWWTRTSTGTVSSRGSWPWSGRRTATSSWRWRPRNRSRSYATATTASPTYCSSTTKPDSRGKPW